MDSLTFSLVLVVLFFANDVYSQVLSSGRCPNIHTFPSFDIHQFTGSWFDQSGFFDIFAAGNKCSNMTLVPTAANDKLRVHTETINTLTGIPITREGELVRATFWSEEVVDNPGFVPQEVAAKWILQFPLTIPQDFWILETDYENYAIVWSCQDSFIFNTQMLWLKTRVRAIRPDQRDWLERMAVVLIRSTGIRDTQLVRIDQSNC